MKRVFVTLVVLNVAEVAVNGRYNELPYLEIEGRGATVETVLGELMRGFGNYSAPRLVEARTRATTGVNLIYRMRCSSRSLPPLLEWRSIDSKLQAADRWSLEAALASERA